MEKEVEEEEDDSTEEMEMVPKRGIRRCNSVTCGGRRWNRDLNAAINIRANLMHAIDNGGKWHPKFTLRIWTPPSVQYTIHTIGDGDRVEEVYIYYIIYYLHDVIYVYL